MTRRRLLQGLLLLILAANTWSGLARIGFFINRERGEKELAAARMDDALEHLGASLWWQPDNAPGHILMARAVHLSLANGLAVRAWQDAGPAELLAAGTVLVTRGIALSPADAWAWFNLAEVFRGYQLGQERLRRLRIALAAPAGNEPDDGPGAGANATVAAEAQAGPGPAAAAGVQMAGDGVIIAASLQAQALEPTFYFYRDFLSRLELRRGAPSQAADQLRESFRLMPLPSAHGTLDAEILRQMAEAVRQGIDSAAASPHVSAALMARSRAEFHEIVGRLDLAIAAYLELRRLAGPDLATECDYQAARLHQQRAEFAESLPYLQRLLADGGGGSWRPSSLRLLARGHSELGEHEAALAVLADFRDEAPGSFHPLALMAAEHESMGDREEAGRLYRITARRFPHEAGAWTRYIRFLRQEKRYAEALEQAREFARRLPEEPQAADLVRQLETEVARLAP